MSCCIGVGQLNKNFYILLLAILFKILNDLIYDINYTKNNEKKSLYNYESILKNCKLLQSCVKFFSITILSLVYYKYENQQIDGSLLINGKKKPIVLYQEIQNLKFL